MILLALMIRVIRHTPFIWYVRPASTTPEVRHSKVTVARYCYNKYMRTSVQYTGFRAVGNNATNRQLNSNTFQWSGWYPVCLLVYCNGEMTVIYWVKLTWNCIQID